MQNPGNSRTDCINANPSSTKAISRTSCKPPSNAASCTSTLTQGDSRSLEVVLVDSKGSCTHPAHSLNPPSVSSQEFICELKKRLAAERCSRNSTVKMNAEMNEIFLNRIEDIDVKASGDTELKLQTYMDWIVTLMQVNESIITNVSDLERDLTERLALVERGKSDELPQSRRDIATLLKIIQNGYYNNDWCLQGIHLETLSLAEVFDVIETDPEDEEQMHSQLQIVPSEGSANSIMEMTNSTATFMTAKESLRKCKFS